MDGRGTRCDDDDLSNSPIGKTDQTLSIKLSRFMGSVCCRQVDEIEGAASGIIINHYSAVDYGTSQAKVYTVVIG